MYLSVLRDIGADKLKKVIEASGSSIKDELKTDIERITKYISDIEYKIGEKLTIKEMNDYIFGDENKAIEYENKRAIHSLNTLNEKPSEKKKFPDYTIIFKFMKEVFPLKSGTTTYELEDKSYLNDPNDDNFLKPTGYSFNPRKGSLTDKENAILDDQDEITGSEAVYLRENEYIKYCRTMQQLFLAMKISSDIHDYDEHLMNICKEVSQGRIVFPDRNTGKWEDYASTKLFKTSSSDLRTAQHRVDSLTTKVNDLEIDITSLTMENKDLEAEKKLLEGETEQMLGYLDTIKTEMNDDTAFETEFKTKKEAI
ncbi:15872_t:CDS:2, partial [Funneliformis geosporum]